MATSAEKVADLVFEAIPNRQFYIDTHPQRMEIVKMRTEQMVRVENPIDPTPRRP